MTRGQGCHQLGFQRVVDGDLLGGRGNNGDGAATRVDDGDPRVHDADASTSAREAAASIHDDETRGHDGAFRRGTGGPVGGNQRSFVDEVVVYIRKSAPLIGVRKWKDIDVEVKKKIASDVMEKWDLEDTLENKKKIWAIANERYKGWRSTFSATYRAYDTYDERMRHKPEDLHIVEWHYLVLYFGREEFQACSETASHMETEELKATLEKVQEQLQSQVAEREAEKEEHRRQMEELQKARKADKEQLRLTKLPSKQQPTKQQPMKQQATKHPQLFVNQS
ncbi:uncharacterized protein [Miscanthus floridulus]|uniref:uncharacterized protein n=1 Tax=Miscanthus floridulus TaxID=154761 RepID=UPI00345B32FD